MPSIGRIYRKLAALCVQTGVVSIACVAAAEAGISISLPYEQSFTAATSLDGLRWTTQGGTVTHIETGGWRGGAIRITPTTLNEGYSGLGNFFGFGDQQRINVRYLANFGSSFTARAQFEKTIIVHRRNDATRPMIISSANTSNGVIRRFWNPCLGIVCEAPQPGNRFYQPFTVSNTGERTNEWVSFEFETDLNSGFVNLYIHTQDGTVSGLYARYNMRNQETNPLASLIYEIQGLGFYWGPPGEASQRPQDSNTYVLIDELKIDNRYIGPPIGFLEDPPPAAPANVNIRRQ